MIHLAMNESSELILLPPQALNESTGIKKQFPVFSSRVGNRFSRVRLITGFLFAWMMMLFAAGFSTSMATTLEITSYLTGNFGADGTVVNTPGFQNYYVGTTFVGATPIPERRNYFLFDVSGITEPIFSATLKLYVPKIPPDGGAGYISVDPTEDYLVTSTPFTADAIATPGIPPGVAIAMFGSFGTGAPFGLETASVDSKGTNLLIEFSPAGIAALNAARTSSGKFVATGRLTTLGTPPPPLADQLLFSHTDPTGVLTSPTPFPILEIITVPEPGVISVVALGAALLTLFRRHRR
jgi:hypothetical protein